MGCPRWGQRAPAAHVAKKPVAEGPKKPEPHLVHLLSASFASSRSSRKSFTLLHVAHNITPRLKEARVPFLIIISPAPMANEKAKNETRALIPKTRRFDY
eukprot:961611-Prorocentrum_minimum.AAC.2